MIDILSTYLISLPKRQIITIDNHGQLPNEIVSACLSYSRKFTASIYIPSEFGSVSNLTSDHLERILVQKEEAKKGYKICDEYWLLIKEGNFYAGSFDNIDINKKVKTSFDKVFVYRSFIPEIIKVK